MMRFLIATQNFFNNNNNNNKEIMSFLDNLKVSDIPAPKEIITVKSV